MKIKTNRAQGGYVLLEALIASAVLALGMTALFIFWGVLGAEMAAQETMTRDSTLIMTCPQTLRAAFNAEKPQNLAAARQTAKTVLDGAGVQNFELREEGRTYIAEISGNDGKTYVVQIKPGL